MTRVVVIDEEAADEADAQARYYATHAGEAIALAFVLEVEAVYRGLADGRLVGVNHPRVRFRVPVRRVFLDRFPFAVVFFADGDQVMVVAIEALRRRPGYWQARLRSR
jgi:plasmid stabilization system protein ParE